MQHKRKFKEKGSTFASDFVAPKTVDMEQRPDFADPGNGFPSFSVR